MDNKSKRLAVFVSGSGTNFQSIQDEILKGNINGKFVLMISNKSDAYALERAKKYNIDTFVIKEKDFSTYEEYCDTLLKKLKEYQVDYIILAGYLKKIPNNIIQAYPYKIVNIHPALLPKFGGKGMYGIYVHQAVIKAKEKETGPTVHFVDPIYDHGLIIKQRKIQVDPNETPESLQKKVLKEEHKIFPEVVKLLCEDRIKIENNKVIIK